MSKSNLLPFWLICALIGFPQISETIYSPSLPSIATALNAPVYLVEWTLSIYFFAFAIGVGLWGVLSDKIGRRPTMLLGIQIYCLATILCSLSTTITSLLFFRALQALGASVGSVITQTMLRDVLTGQTRARWFASLGIPLSLAPALGPFIGGWLNQSFSWEANFIALFGLGVSLWLVCLKILPETKPANLLEEKKPFFALSWQLVKDKKVVCCALLIALANGIMFSFYAEAPFILMEKMKLSATEYGFSGLVIGAGGIVGSLLSRKLQSLISLNRIIIFGCGLSVLGSLGLVLLAYANVLNEGAVWLGLIPFLMCLFIIILGALGMAIPLVLSTALSQYQNVVGTASSLFGLGYYILIAFLTALMGEIHDGTVFPLPWYFLILSILMVFCSFMLIEKKSKTVLVASTEA